MQDHKQIGAATVHPYAGKYAGLRAIRPVSEATQVAKVHFNVDFRPERTGGRELRRFRL